MIRRALLVAALVGFAAATPAAVACASCGGAGDDPLVLFPNETWKLYLGASRQAGFESVTADGTRVSSGGPERKDLLVFAAGYGISPRAFVTVAVPYARNARDDDARSALADPSVAGRYTLVMPSLATPWIPQVQLVGGYKAATARSVRDAEDKRTLLDAFGTGFPETRAGVDVWLGLFDLKTGVAHLVAAPEARSFDGVRYAPGLVHRTTGTVAYSWTLHQKTTLGAVREHRGAFAVDGVDAPRTEQLSHTAFSTHDWSLTPQDAVRLGVARQGAFLTNRNTARAWTTSLAYMRTL